jgi:hypothetical protein
MALGADPELGGLVGERQPEPGGPCVGAKDLGLVAHLERLADVERVRIQAGSL